MLDRNPKIALAILLCLCLGVAAASGYFFAEPRVLWSLAPLAWWATIIPLTLGALIAVMLLLWFVYDLINAWVDRTRYIYIDAPRTPDEVPAYEARMKRLGLHDLETIKPSRKGRRYTGDKADFYKPNRRK